MNEPDDPATLAADLRRRIAATGPISIAAFMADALYHPQFGYYTGSDPIGAAGDFITAPEISQMFGELLGLWCAETWMRLGRPDPVALIELGPGHGTLMQDALRAVTISCPTFAAAARVHLVETSPRLRQRQQALLGKQDPPPTWHDRLDTVPALPSLVIANEVFDALPIRQFQRTEAGWCERLVDVDPNDPSPSFRFGLGRPSGAAEALLPDAVRRAPLGSVVEICPAALALTETLASLLADAGGAALFIDYGYVGPRTGETLQGVRRHRPESVLAAPGRTDLTAHVDFAALADTAVQAGTVVFGPIAQGTFLRRLGIETRATLLARQATPLQKTELDSALTRLIAPDQMGTLFKAMCLTGPTFPGPPAGFEAPEQWGRDDDVGDAPEIPDGGQS